MGGMQRGHCPPYAAYTHGVGREGKSLWSFMSVTSLYTCTQKDTIQYNATPLYPNSTNSITSLSLCREGTHENNNN